MKHDVIALLIFGLLTALSCSVHQTKNTDTHQQETLDSAQSQEISAETLQAVEDFISSTPYSALIQHTGVDVVPVPDPYPDDDYAEEKQIYHARVIETFRGQQLKNISYALYCEQGEEANVGKEPVVVTLCVDDEGFFWPGVGAEFPATEKIVETARQIGQKVKYIEQSFPDCERTK